MAIKINHPLRKPRVTSKYGERVMDGVKEFHSGVDYGAEKHGVKGDPVMACNSGTVKVAKYNKGGYGNFVVIEHNGYCSLYAHLHRYLVAVGQYVKQGETIGYMGNTGRSTAVHLHFEIRPVEYAKFAEKQIILGKEKPLHMINPLKCL